MRHAHHVQHIHTDGDHLPTTELLWTRHAMLLFVGIFPVVLARVAVWGVLEAPPAPHHKHHKF